MPNYARFDGLDDFETFYREEIAPALRADPDVDVDPDHKTPSYAWLKRNYSGFVERLRRDHDRSPGEFYETVGLPPRPDDGEDPWGIDHEPTARGLEDYLEELERDRGRAETTVGPRRSRLKTYVTTYRDVNGTGDLLTPLLDETAKPDEIARVRDAFRVLDDELGTLASKKKYVSAVKNWYTFLEEMGRGLYNPAENLLNRFGWDEEPLYDHPALGRDDLAALLAAGDDDERFLLLALAGWGLRPVEACELHVDQLVLDPDDGDVPYVEFEAGQRKNARRTRNTVEILVGVDAVRDRLDALAAADDWAGYLLPGRSAGAPMSTETARRWFRRLGARADVEIAGGHPLPKMGRRTWYRLYRRQRPNIRAGTAAVAASQGSRDASVSERNYLDERTRRRARADAMRDLVRDELAEIFDEYL
ncbi:MULTISPECIES: tyrosine-type recombinase/integrase [Halorussus]|uniref:tyrosine-type recombinase/integrase n=1 Tax=Halorussus TaxID=1070314 RepID=UPI00209D7CE8|nr:tyrosine-type recombinase/integrase [Halorussus vallis]USZ78276.1 site-specific integrase [Halorussus vallis]